MKRKKWSGRRDSNPRPSPWQGDALPTEPLPLGTATTDGWWCREPGSNWRHRDFQSRALPTELSRPDGQPGSVARRRGRGYHAGPTSSALSGTRTRPSWIRRYGVPAEPAAPGRPDTSDAWPVRTARPRATSASSEGRRACPPLPASRAASPRSPSGAPASGTTATSRRTRPRGRRHRAEPRLLVGRQRRLAGLLERVDRGPVRPPRRERRLARRAASGPPPSAGDLRDVDRAPVAPLPPRREAAARTRRRASSGRCRSSRRRAPRRRSRDQVRLGLPVAFLYAPSHSSVGGLVVASNQSRSSSGDVKKIGSSGGVIRPRRQSRPASGAASARSSGCSPVSSRSRLIRSSDRRVGREQAARALLELLDRVREVQVLGRPVGDLEDLLVAGDLGQRPLEPVRVARQLDRRRVGEVLALAADGELDEAGRRSGR